MHAMNAKGFGLLELLIVLPMVGILATLAISLLTKANQSACDAVAKSDLRNTFTTIDFYLVQNNRYLSSSADPQVWGRRWGRNET